MIRLSQDSAITAFQSRQEYQSRQASYEAFEALRKPQLSLRLVPNYTHIVSDPTRDYVYLRNFDIFSSAQLRLSQKMLPFGGEAYVGTQAIWSEFFREEASGHPRQFVASPLLVGYSHSLLGYNPFRWEKQVEDQRLKAARQQHEYDLRRIAEEAAVRYFRLLCRQRLVVVRQEELSLNDTVLAIAREKATIAIVTQQELQAMELQLQNSVNLLAAASRMSRRQGGTGLPVQQQRRPTTQRCCTHTRHASYPSHIPPEEVAMLARATAPLTSTN